MALALDADPPRSQPDHRVEPVQRAGHASESLGQAIAPLHVRQLMQQDVPQALARPAFN
jgi:hypothetical protein